MSNQITNNPSVPSQVVAQVTFPKFMNTLGIIPTSYKDSMTYYECLVWLCKFLEETVIPTVNQNGEAVQELQNLYVELNSYVTNYFDNLDVQEEINNKLDDMVEAGTLQEIITAYLNTRAIFCYDNVSTMKEATNLQDGSYAKTLGYNSKDDKGGAVYYITENEPATYYETLDSGLYACLVIDPEMNVKQFGAKGDGTTDDTTAFQNCIASGANVIIVPETDDFYLITDDLELLSNQTLKGYGKKSKILMPNNLVKTLILLEYKTNVTLDNVKLCNESCQTGSSPDLSKNKILWAENCSDITIKNCYFENVYSRGILFRKTKNIYYYENEFKNSSFEMLTLLQEVENAFIDKCVFDTCVSTYQNTYLFATGKIDNETYDFSCRNIHVTNSKFLNNPNWEGIDTHACVGFYVENNYIENVKCGIMAEYASTAPLTTSSRKHGDIFIRNNIIKGYIPQDNNTYGIIVGSGNSTSDSMFICENVNIENNTIENFGFNTNNGNITIIFTKNFKVSNNILKNSNYTGLTISGAFNGEISNNKILECNTNGININGGCWNVQFNNNIIQNLEKSKLPNGIRGGANLQIYVKGHNNSIYATNLFTNVHVLSGVYVANSCLVGKIGDLLLNTYGLAIRYCTDNILRLYKTPSITVSGLEGTNVITGSNLSFYVGEGLEIILPIGENGENVTTMITKIIDKNTFEIKDTIITNISGVTPTFTQGTWTSVS